ncbi:MAG: type I-C CRISPR-associated protein Cas5c [bacterium]|jgi:CRISPR-associated protein Cas5d
MSDKQFVLEIWGDLACFSRPELKVERFSYPVITPSAARGILDAIYCKPTEFQWRIHRVEILKPIRYIALRRNEVKEVISVSAVQKYMSGAREIEPIYADDTPELAGTDKKGRTQRQTMALRDVRYRIFASIRPKTGQEQCRKAIVEQAERRISRGKCFQQPYLGCREFAAYFEQYDPAVHRDEPAVVDLDLGYMLYDVFDLSMPGGPQAGKPAVSLFHAFIKQGVMEVPDYESDQVLKPA